eukprot:UN33675
MILTLFDLGQTEINAYQSGIKTLFDIEMPTYYGSAFRKQTGRLVMILEDLGPRNIKFVSWKEMDDEIIIKCTEHIAKFHAQSVQLEDDSSLRKVFTSFVQPKLRPETWLLGKIQHGLWEGFLKSAMNCMMHLFQIT